MGEMKKEKKLKKTIIVGLGSVLLLLGIGGCSLLQQKGPELTNWEPVLSPDGTTIAFESPGEKGFEIFTRDLETGTIMQLTQNEVDDWSPSWSPQGDRIAFSSNQEKNVDLYVIDVETLTVIRLTTHDGDDVNPCWGVNDRILFNSNRTGVWEIYMIDPDGQGLTKVTETASSE